jgi:hypothetical protein
MRIVCSLLLAACCVRAQQDLATVTGRVTDTTQAVVPGVRITAANIDTGVARSMAATSSGDYAITNLPPGSYELSAEASGFRKYRRTGLVLETGQTLRADVQLEIGSMTESVTVTAQVAALNTDNGRIKGDVIVQQEIQSLPLDGRDFTDLAFLVPGVTPNAQGGLGSGMAVNGARADSTNFYVDGFDNRDTRIGDTQVRPNIDAMQEFKMEVAGFSAEYGKMAGGILNAVLKSGTNELHGGVFEYVRNNVIDSRSFFDAEKLKLNRHQFGATVNGPVVLPRAYDGRNRTFFLFSWESYRQIQGQTSLTRVPTNLERNGDLSQTLNQFNAPATPVDPLARNAPFPGSRVPASRVDPVAQKLLAHYPMENRPGQTFNYLVAANNTDSLDSYIWKIDQHLGDKDNLSFRHQARLNPGFGPFNGNALGLFGAQSDRNGTLAGLGWTHLFSPTLLVEIRAGFNRQSNSADSTSVGVDYARQLGIPGSTTDPALMGFPQITLLGYSSIGAHNSLPTRFSLTNIQGGLKFTWVRSRHVMKWGYDQGRNRFNQPFYNGNRGLFVVQDKWTGLAMGDLLLGMLNNTSRTVGAARNYLRQTNIGTFFNDDLKLLPNLTLNLGVRFEIDDPPSDRYDRIASFVPGLDQLVVSGGISESSLNTLAAQAGLTGKVVLRGQTGLPNSLVFPDRNNVAPRAGFAWRFGRAGKTVVRGGYGIFYTGFALNPIRGSLMAVFPYSTNETYTRVATQPAQVTFSNPFPAERLALGGVNNVAGYDAHAPIGYLQSYNLTIERDLGGATVLEAGFAGSKGTHLGRVYNINQPFQSIATYLAGISATSLRPYPFNAVNYYQFGGNSNYSAGQISLRKRGRGGLFYRLNYTFSKSIDTASQLSAGSDGGFNGALDMRNLRLERGRSDWDRRQVFTSNFFWPLPFGRGRRFIGSAGRGAQSVLGGWQVSGTAMFGSGAPLTVLTNGASQNIGESLRPNRIGSGEPAGRDGKRGVDYPWFNLNDFKPAPACISVARGCPADAYGFQPFLPGNAGRNILDGPGYGYVNLAAMKDFPVRERMKAQFRFESFNFLNHPNFMLPDNSFNTITAGRITGAVPAGKGGPRVFQASLKFLF